MAKSIDRCVCGDCSNVPMKGSDECCACAYIPEPLPSMDECYGNERSCLVENCFNTPKMFELICDSCVEKHESSDTPGFPSEYDCDTEVVRSDWLDFELSTEGQAFADKADQYEVDKCSGDGESYDFRAEDFLDEVVPDQKCRRAFMSEVPCDKDGTFRDDCCKTHWVELDALQAPIRERSYNERKDAWSVD